MSIPINVWLHPPETMNEHDELLEKLAERGVNNVIVNLKGWSGQVKYPSAIAHHTISEEALEIVGLMLEKSQQLAMSFEAWVCTFTESNESNLLKKHPELRAKSWPDEEKSIDEDGAIWPCPASETVKEYQLSICREIIESFPSIDAIHLDYIRYPWSNGKVCSCKSCQKEFKEKYGFDLFKDVITGGGGTGQGFNDFLKWRCGNIRDLVARVRKLTAQTNHKLSAAVFPFYPSIMFDIGQDWIEWCHADLLDTVNVMNYNWSPELVGRYTSLHTHFLGDKKSILMEGIWLHENMTRKDVEQLCAAAMDNGAAGLSFFVGQTLANFPKDILSFLNL